MLDIFDSWDTFYWTCEVYGCRVIEFYAEDESETVCPQCGSQGYEVSS